MAILKKQIFRDDVVPAFGATYTANRSSDLVVPAGQNGSVTIVEATIPASAPDGTYLVAASVRYETNNQGGYQSRLSVPGTWGDGINVSVVSGWRTVSITGWVTKNGNSDKAVPVNENFGGSTNADVKLQGEVKTFLISSPPPAA